MMEDGRKLSESWNNCCSQRLQNDRTPGIQSLTSWKENWPKAIQKKSVKTSRNSKKMWQRSSKGNIGEIKENTEKLLKDMATLKNAIKNIPDFIVEMETVCSPYMFRTITTEDLKHFEEEAERKEQSDGTVLAALERAETFFDHALGILNELVSEKWRDQAKRHVRNKAWQKISGHSKEVAYLQLLCGWTFKPVVTYKVETDKYSESVVAVAQFEAKICAVGIKAACLWNVASGVARMFGYPVPQLPG
jgi:hypothetical protein